MQGQKDDDGDSQESKTIQSLNLDCFGDEIIGYIDIGLPAPATHSRLSLLGLPGELRNRIWHFTFAGSRGSSGLQLLLTSRQVYHEAQVEAWQSTAPELWNRRSSFPDRTRKKLAGVPSQKLMSIKSVEIGSSWELYMGDICEYINPITLIFTVLDNAAPDDEDAPYIALRQLTLWDRKPHLNLATIIIEPLGETQLDLSKIRVHLMQLWQVFKDEYSSSVITTFGETIKDGEGMFFKVSVSALHDGHSSIYLEVRVHNS